MGNVTETTIAIVAAKNAGYVAAFLTGIEFLGLMPTSVVVLLIMILTDIISGILKSASLHGGQAIKSSIFERGVLAKALVIGIPFNLALVGKGIGLDLSAIAQGTITVLILSEFYSILGNFYAIRTGVERVEFDAVAASVSKIRSLLKAFIQD